MRRRLCLAVVAAAFILGSGGTCKADDATKPPNIVFILADDLGINDLACYGRKDQPTPKLDRLAEQGVRFTNAYAAQCLCSPTRAAILTGKSPARLHLTTYLPGRPDAVSQPLLHPRINLELPRDVKTCADRLKAAGYATGAIGKWHLGGKGNLPTDRGFDVYFPGHANTKPTETEGSKGEYELTAQAEKFIDDNKARPFFLYLAHNNPHIPIAARPDQVEKHKDAFNPVYASVIESLDDCVGRVVAKVDALGLGERTLIVFTSDNGGLHVLEAPHTPATHNTPYRAGKGYCYEGGHRIPLIVRWTGKVKEKSTSAVPVISTDWTPTFLAVAGVKSDEAFDGVNLLGLLTKGEALADRPLCWHWPHYSNQGGRPSGAIRQGDWKLLEHYEDGRCELFNLAQDPGESKDRSADEPGRVAEMRGKLEKWRRDAASQSNTANPDFNPVPWRKLYFDVDSSRLVGEGTAAALAKTWAPWRALMNEVLPPRDAKAKPKIAGGAGAILLHARDAKVHGKKLRYEPEPHKDTLGFWVERDDWAEWTFDAPHAGTFEVEVLQGCGKGSGGAEIEIAVGDEKVTLKIEETGHFQRFVPRGAGSIKLEKAGTYTLTVKARSKPRGAVMDLRRILLRAAPPS